LGGWWALERPNEAVPLGPSSASPPPQTEQSAAAPAHPAAPAAAPNGADLAKAEDLFNRGEYKAAIALFQRVLANDPDSVPAQNGLKSATDAKATEDLIFGAGGKKKSARTKPAPGNE
jgi:tetratricopeptide (TPR) repeat protein